MIRSEMMERMSASEFNEWMALEHIEPFGDRRADLNAGYDRATLWNIFEAYVQGHSENYTAKTHQPHQHMLDFDKEPVDTRDRRSMQMKPEAIKQALMLMMFEQQARAAKAARDSAAPIGEGNTILVPR